LNFELLSHQQLLSTPTGRRVITSSALMTDEQYDAAEEDLLVRMQLMMERDSGHVEPIVLSPVLDDDSLDDPIVKSFSSERERAKDEYRVYCNIVKRRNHVPQSFSGTVLRLGCIRMGKVATRGDDIKASHPFVTCNLATYIGDDGRFDLVSFLELQRATFPTLYKLAVCLASVRMNEVGCECFSALLAMCRVQGEPA
jgi:hypothetical protein